MASTGFVNGSDFGVFVDDTLISTATECQLQLTKNMIVVNNKDSGRSAEYMPGRGDGTVSGTARIKYAAGFGFSDLFALYKNDTKVTIRYSNDEAGDEEYSFDAYISELSRTDPDDDNSTLSFTFQKTGDITETVVA